MSGSANQRTLYLVHHHLRRGGVTRVIFSCAEILRDAGEQVCILSGEAASEKVPEGISYKIIPELGYADSARPTDREALLKALRKLYREGDIWHLHNHSLGKNPVVTDVFCSLAEAGQILVLQPHDFAEDGRPANLALLRESFPGFPDRLYPIGAHIRYAVLQERDRQVLTDGGVPAESIQVLPNPIDTSGGFAPPAQPPLRILYMTRAIRRKNVGEFLYWAKCYGEDLEFATSLIPENPQELKGFYLWQAFAQQEKIDVQWGIGMNGRSFGEVVDWSDTCITTSVGEGFGMSFLEPFAMGRQVLGRNLSDITVGFEQAGVDLSQLYTCLPVPLDMLDEDFWPRACSQLQHWRKCMGVDTVLSEADLKTAWVSDARIDFGRLDETAQRVVLQKMAAADFSCELAPFHPQPVSANAKVIHDRFGPGPYKTRLKNLYADLQASGKVGYANGDRIRDAFLDLATVRLLRT